MNKFVGALLAVALLAPVGAAPALAHDNDRHEGWRPPGIVEQRGHGQERDGYRDRYEDGYHDRHEGGHWFHGRHNNVVGSWWIADGLWRFVPPYPTAMYPYPASPRVVVVQPPPQPQYYYYMPRHHY